MFLYYISMQYADLISYDVVLCHCMYMYCIIVLHCIVLYFILFYCITLIYIVHLVLSWFYDTSYHPKPLTFAMLFQCETYIYIRLPSISSWACFHFFSSNKHRKVTVDSGTSRRDHTKLWSTSYQNGGVQALDLIPRFGCVYKLYSRIQYTID